MSPPFQARFNRLAAARSPLCVGIDPSAEALRQWRLGDDPAGLRRFCETLIDAAAPLVAVVKPQLAFFERFGPAGLAVLRAAVDRAHAHGALVILDAKRGDIASTAAAYAEAFLGPASLAPIVAAARREGAGVFVVVRSSNPEGAGLQRAAMADGRSVARSLADDITAENAGDDGPLGAVVGATLGPEAGDIAARLPNALLLVPGIGAQGATIADVRRDFGPHYRRVVPSLSRGIARAGPDPAALRQEVERLAAELRA